MRGFHGILIALFLDDLLQLAVPVSLLTAGLRVSSVRLEMTFFRKQVAS